MPSVTQVARELLALRRISEELVAGLQILTSYSMMLLGFRLLLSFLRRSSVTRIFISGVHVRSTSLLRQVLTD